jgi:hypothetical protein
MGASASHFNTARSIHGSLAHELANDQPSKKRDDELKDRENHALDYAHGNAIAAVPSISQAIVKRGIFTVSLP